MKSEISLLVSRLGINCGTTAEADAMATTFVAGRLQQNRHASYRHLTGNRSHQTRRFLPAPHSIDRSENLKKKKYSSKDLTFFTDNDKH
jgi:hypothetical protein